MEVLLLSEREIRDLIGPAEALPAVRDACVRMARGEAILPGVIHLDIPKSGAEAHVKGAHLQGSGSFTIKVASGSYANPDRGLPTGSGVVLVFDATTGFPQAVLFDNGYLTNLRTGAAGGAAGGPPSKGGGGRGGVVGGGGQARFPPAGDLRGGETGGVPALGRPRGEGNPLF